MIDDMVASPSNGVASAKGTKKKQRSLRKVKASFPENGDDDGDDDDIGGLVIRPISQTMHKVEFPRGEIDPAAIIAARKQKRKDARKMASVGTSGVDDRVKPSTLYSSTKDDYSKERIKEMAGMNIRVTGSFRRNDATEDDAVRPMGFRAPDDVAMHDSPSVDETEDSIDGDIPDEKSIQKIKAKRERIRSGEMDVDVSHIPVGIGHGADVPDVIDQRRMHDEEENDDIEEWTNDQIRKGMSSGAARGLEISSLPSLPRAQERFGSVVSIARDGFTSLASIDPIDLIDEIHKEIHSQFESINLTLKQHTQGILRTRENLSDIEQKIHDDQSMIKDLNEEFIKSQEMKQYVSSLCYMLREKSPIIEELQSQLFKSRLVRAKAKSDQFTLQIEEIRLTSSKGVDAGMSVLMKGGTDAEAVLASDQAVRNAQHELSLGTHIPESLDEFGRDLNAEKRYKIKVRIDKMNERFTTMQASGKQNAVDGLLIDDESEDDFKSFTQRQHDIKIECRSIFNDTAEEFSSIESVRYHLESWKARFAEQYAATYMGLSTPALFAPFVRLELIDWNPLDTASSPFTQHKWYLNLFEYGIDAPKSDPDHDLIPNLVKSIVLPMVMDLCRDVWEPVNVGQSRSLATTLEDIIVHFDSKTSDFITNVSGLLVKRLNHAVDFLQPPQWHPSGMNTTARAKLFWRLLFKISTDLLQSILCFRSLIPANDLDSVAFGTLGKSLLQFIRGCMLEQDDCLNMIDSILCAIPEDAMETSGAVGHSLNMFLREISSVVHAMSDASPLLSSDPRFKKIARLLPSTVGRHDF